MDKNTIYILLILFALQPSCRKVDVPPAQDDDPIFSVDASFINNDISIKAGLENFYMFSDFSKDQDDVYTYVARLAKDQDCVSDCEESLTVSIRAADRPTGGNVLTIDQLLKTGSLDFYLKDSTPSPVYQYDFQTFPLTGPVQAFHDWTIQGTGIGSVNLVGENVSQIVMNADSILVNLETTTFNMNQECVSSFSRIISPNQVCNLNLIDFSSQYSPDSMLVEITVETDSFGGSINYLWSDGSTAPTGIFELNPNGSPTTVELIITDQTGCFISSTINVMSNNVGGIDICATAFNYSVEEIIPPNDFQLSTVSIEYVNSDGQRFSSDLDMQTANSFFEITSIEDFEMNENGEATKKLKVEFACELFNDDNVPFPFSGSAVIAVAYE